MTETADIAAAPVPPVHTLPAARRRVAYLCNLYPAVSHTFVYREVAAMRERGVDVTTFSIHRADTEHQLSEEDRAEARTTYAVLPPRWREIVVAHLRVSRWPRAYLATLATALRMAAPGPRGRLWQLFYLAEAVMLWDQCERQGLRHVHVHLANNAADAAMLMTELGNAIDGERRWSWSFTMHGPTEFYDVSHFRLA
ncbi:MAG: hypothetical protein JOZ73_08925, partial [Solirubrobacterales bacterium]|nr:hypothetical protein [Solirubrobacterales bacterium]